MPAWYSRPVFFVTEVENAIGFYVERLGFAKVWQYDEEEKPLVVQIARGDCEIILAIDPLRAGKSRLFIELMPEEMTAFQTQLEEGKLEFVEGWWGYPVIEIRDPDGNELLFPMDE